MNELPYPSDLTAAQWALIEPLLPAPKPKGRKRRVDLRKITNAILYVLKGGISWRMLPREFAPWKTVYHYFRLWRLAGLWDRIHDQLRDQVRVSKGRHICPSAAIVDSQSVATQQKGAIGATMLRSAPKIPRPAKTPLNPLLTNCRNFASASRKSVILTTSRAHAARICTGSLRRQNRLDFP